MIFSYFWEAMKKALTTPKKKLRSKGDRLNWIPLAEVKPLSLKDDIGEGKWLTEEDLKRFNYGEDTKHNYLIP